MSSSIHPLRIAEAFDGLSLMEKSYAHHLSRAAWYGARIILRQTSEEAIDIFDFILCLHRSCLGDWDRLANDADITSGEMLDFVDYAGAFLSNIGNYYGSGDRKFVPAAQASVLEKLAMTSTRTKKLWDHIAGPIYAIPPSCLGYPSCSAQTMYYFGDEDWSKDEILDFSKFVDKASVLPENTRLKKVVTNGNPSFEIHVASTRIDEKSASIGKLESGAEVFLIHGDHAEDLKKICGELRKALEFVGDEAQRRDAIEKYIESFETGDLAVYKDSQRAWIRDTAPTVENVMGFVEPYRDPQGVRAEFEGIVAISNSDETRALSRLVDESSKFIKRLPWTQDVDVMYNDGKGPFEKGHFEPPDFTSIHALVYCSSYLFEGINLPNYNDIRQECGFKNVIIANRMSVEGDATTPSPYFEGSDSEHFQRHRYHAYYLSVVIHELLGHGTSKLLIENSDGSFNFDIQHPPINPLTGRPINTWYKAGQTWTSVFSDLATTVDECRAELVASYLIDDLELLALFGFTGKSDTTAEDVTYNKYQQLGDDGVRSLVDFDLATQSWGRAHSRAHFATLKWLLRDGGKCLKIESDKEQGRLTVRLDRSVMINGGKASIGRLLLRLQIYRCTADVVSCRKLFEDLSSVDGEYLEWRDIVLQQPKVQRRYAQANTCLTASGVTLKEYEPTNKGIIQSWADRYV